MASKIRKLINKKVSKALLEFEMIRPGDKLLLGLSGGMDSMTLLHELSGRMRAGLFNFSLQAVFCQNDFSEVVPVGEYSGAAAFLKDYCQKLEIPFEVIDLGVERRLKEGETLNCYWCSLQRRGALMDYAVKNDFTTLVLGHHLDDMVETLLMNTMYKASFEGMPPVMDFRKYPVRLIRPLMYVEKVEIRKYIQELELAELTCTCDFSKNSHRVHVREGLKVLTDNKPALKYNILKAAKANNWNM